MQMMNAPVWHRGNNKPVTSTNTMPLSTQTVAIHYCAMLPPLNFERVEAEI